MTAALATTPRWARATAAVRRLVATRWPLPRGKHRLSDLLLGVLGEHAFRMPGRTHYGAWIRCDLRDLVQSRIYNYGVWEPHLTAYLTSRLHPGDLFVDVGANVGYFTLLASKLVGSTGRVVAVDASPHVFARLNDGVALNDASNVRTVNAAVSDRPGKLPVFLGAENNLGRTSTIAARGGAFETEVDALRLFDILTPDERTRVRVLKIDIEGAEGPVLADLVRHLDELPSLTDVVVEAAPDAMEASGVPLGPVIEAFTARGFAWYTLVNHYDFTDYESSETRLPEPGTEVPTEQADIIFSRPAPGGSPRRAGG